MRAGGDPQGAAEAFGAVLEADPENAAALAGLVRCHLQQNQVDEARAVLDRLPAQPGEPADIAGARAALALAEEAAEAADSGEIGELRQRLEVNPKDHETRIDLSVALNAAGQREAAAEALLAAVRLDRNWNDQAARKQLLKLFDAWGPTDPLTVETRRQLSTTGRRVPKPPKSAPSAPSPPGSPGANPRGGGPSKGITISVHVSASRSA